VSEHHECLDSAAELLVLVNEALKAIENGEGLYFHDGKLRLRCVICGKGTYRFQNTQLQIPLHTGQAAVRNSLPLRWGCCDVCFHYAMFAPGFPEDAEGRGWKSAGSS
jgi:hypothetical protein